MKDVKAIAKTEDTQRVSGVVLSLVVLTVLVLITSIAGAAVPV